MRVLILALLLLAACASNPPGRDDSGPPGGVPDTGWYGDPTERAAKQDEMIKLAAPRLTYPAPNISAFPQHGGPQGPSGGAVID